MDVGVVVPGVMGVNVSMGRIIGVALGESVVSIGPSLALCICIRHN